MSDTDSLSSLRARIAAHESWANTTNRSARTAPARAAFDARFLEQAGGDPVRARHLRKAYYARLALQSAKARREARDQAELDADLAHIGGDAHGDPAA